MTTDVKRLNDCLEDYIKELLHGSMFQEHSDRAGLMGLNHIDVDLEANDGLKELGVCKLEFKVYYQTDYLEVCAITLIGDSRLLRLDISELYQNSFVTIVKVVSIYERLSIQEFKNLFHKYVQLDIDLRNEDMSAEVSNGIAYLDLLKLGYLHFEDFEGKLIKLSYVMREIEVKEFSIDLYNLGLNSYFAGIYKKVKEIVRAKDYVYVIDEVRLNICMFLLRNIMNGLIQKGEVYKAKLRFYIGDDKDELATLESAEYYKLDDFFEIDIQEKIERTSELVHKSVVGGISVGYN